MSVVDGAPRIAETDQRTLLLHGIAFTFEFSKLVCALDRPSPVRCIVGANETNATFRFHQIRPGETWHNPDLDGYRMDKLIVIDIKPAATACRTQTAVENQGMDVPRLLETASLLAPEEIATENDITVSDVWELLVQDEWEVALVLLEELGDTHALPPGFWAALATAAEHMQLEQSAAWCHWRCWEARNGIIRADLAVRPATETRRRTPIPGAGILRPMWDIGIRTPTGEPTLHIARLWVEFTPFLEPGQQSSVRLAPLDPAQWQHLQPGQEITMHEDRSIAGTAVVVEVHRPTATPFV